MQQAAAYNARVNFSVEKVGTLHGSVREAGQDGDNSGHTLQSGKRKR